MCVNVAVQRRWRIIVQKGAVCRNPIETPAFVDERKSPSNVGRFYPMWLTAVGACAVRASQASSEGSKCQTLMRVVSWL